MAIFFRRFVDIENLYKPEDVTMLDFSAILQYHYHGGLKINSAFYKQVKLNLISSINNKYHLQCLYSLYPFLTQCVSEDPTDIIFQSIETTSNSVFDQNHVDVLFQCVLHRMSSKDIKKLIDLSESIDFVSKNAMVFLKSCLETWQNEFPCDFTTNSSYCESVSDFFYRLLSEKPNEQQINTNDRQLREAHKNYSKSRKEYTY